VIVDDFHLLGVVAIPDEADAVLIVDPDAVLPLRWPFNGSSRLPGGERRNSSVAAAFNTTNLRIATLAIAAKRRERPVSNKTCVSVRRKLRIMLAQYNA
jgi:hypothetical protein